MEFKLTVALPRDSLSIPVIRRVMAQTMRALGVQEDCIADIELAVTEACTNVLDHATDGEEYEVSSGIDADRCVIEVVDTGTGFDATLQGLADAPEGAETGRGIQLMRALVDTVQFESRVRDGTVVRLEKALSFRPDAPFARLSGLQTGPWSSDRRLRQEAPH